MSTVVIVDDQSTSRRILAELVQRLEDDLAVESFADPVEAIEWLEGNPSDLVLTDYKMPRLNGVEFTQRFRAIPQCCDIPLVVITVLCQLSCPVGVNYLGRFADVTLLC